MKIKHARIFTATLPYRRPFIIAGGATTVAEHVFVELESASGHIGIGEAAPMPSYWPETPESIIAALKGGMLEQVIGEAPFHFERILTKLDNVTTDAPFATAAIDFALHDLAGKYLNTPTYNLMGGPVRERVDLSWAVGMGEPEAMADEAARYVKCGYRTVKLKVGNNAAHDLEAVRLTRERIGPRVNLRIDGNQGYSLDDALKVLPELERHGLEMIEQPVSRDDIGGMAKLCAELDTPILADESLFNLQDAHDLVRHRAADIFNIKVMKPGGLWRSKKIAAVAEAASIPCEVGSMIEMGPGTAAGLHFALSTRNVRFACEMIGHEMLDGDVIEDEPWIAPCRNGYLELPTKPGLGFTMRTDTTYVD